MMNDQEDRKAEFITTNTQAREIYLDGYLRGYAAGFRDADQSADDAAQAAYDRAVQTIVKAGGAR